MTQAVAASAIAHQIQLAVAPVFLLAGIGSILNVMAGRLARVVERARGLEREFASFDEEMRMLATAELRILDQRMTVVNLALSACTAAALSSASWSRCCSSPISPMSPLAGRSPGCS